MCWDVSCFIVISIPRPPKTFRKYPRQAVRDTRWKLAEGTLENLIRFVGMVFLVLRNRLRVVKNGLRFSAMGPQMEFYSKGVKI